MWTEETPIAAPAPTCSGCGHALAEQARFCTACGRAVQESVIERKPLRELERFFWAVGLIMAYILGSYLVDSWEDHRKLLAFDVGFFLLVVMIALVMRTELGSALRASVPREGRLFNYLILQVVLTLLVFKTLPLLVQWVGTGMHSYTWIFWGSGHPFLYAMLSTAIFPALTEELAFRGILFGQLQRLSGTTNAIIVTAILFAFVHFAMLSLYWLLPCGLLYGWIRAREGHIWWGVVLHACHNGLVVLNEFGVVHLM